jgi:hypothetical protein
MGDWDLGLVEAAVFAGRTMAGAQSVPAFDTHTVTPRAGAYQT